MTCPTRTRLVAATAIAALLAACSPSAGPAPTAPAPVPPVATGSEHTPEAGTPDLSAPQTVATGLEVPWGLAFLPDGSALVAERGSGRIQQVRVGGNVREVYRMPGVEAVGEGGLLGLAVDPDYQHNRWVYAYFTAAQDNRIVRFRLDDGGKPQVILDGIDKNTFHNGGRIAFGPDGMLYAGTGDAGDRPQSQNRTDPNGKILRITREGRPAPGNPDPSSPVWSMGHRNVQGLAWDANATMYGIEFGQNTWDEVNVIKPGANYGWPEVEGRSGDNRYVDPIVQWHTNEASPSGAAVAGRTLYVAALRGQRLWTVPLDGGTPRAKFVGQYGRLRTVAVAPDGALWLTTSNRDGRGTVRAGDDRILRFPAR